MGEKLQKLIDWYYYFFDHKLKNTTIIIWLVGTLVLCVWIFIGWSIDTEKQYNAKSNILEIQPWQIMEIWGKKYTLQLDSSN